MWCSETPGFCIHPSLQACLRLEQSNRRRSRVYAAAGESMSNYIYGLIARIVTARIRVVKRNDPSPRWCQLGKMGGASESFEFRPRCKSSLKSSITTLFWGNIEQPAQLVILLTDNYTLLHVSRCSVAAAMAGCFRSPEPRIYLLARYEFYQRVGRNNSAAFLCVDDCYSRCLPSGSPTSETAPPSSQRRTPDPTVYL